MEKRTKNDRKKNKSMIIQTDHTQRSGKKWVRNSNQVFDETIRQDKLKQTNISSNSNKTRRVVSKTQQ